MTILELPLEHPLITPNEPTQSQQRWARIVLCHLAEPGDPYLGELTDRVGAVRAMDLLRHDPAATGLPATVWQRLHRRLGNADPQASWRRARRQQVRYVIPGDLEWPTQLDVLGQRRPLGLWVRGAANLRLWALRSVAIVGARACTEYGRYVTRGLASELAAQGWTVISGAAYGIDAAAHQGALAADGRTVGVLACGVDVAYPKAHEQLLSTLAREGLIVSELPSGVGVARSRFLERNRVIAALARGTVVVEAALRSGALNTAGHARDQMRQVMAVPGPVTSAASAGCHEIIRAGEASLVTCASDVIDLIGDIGADEQPRRRGEDRPTDQLSATEVRVFEVLATRRWRGFDELASLTGLGIPVLAAAVGRLTDMGLAVADGQTWRLATDRE